MHLAGIARYPIKGLNGEELYSVTLECGRGVRGDRRFAFGIDASKDDGTWYTSRSYLINSRKDNLLKFSQRSDQIAWEITSPSGQVLRFNADDADSLKRVNTQLGPFFSCIENDGKTPCLIDRNPDEGPSGHWDFPDSELLIVNLATVHELESHWGVEIDPRRFRANLLIEGLPPWAEFGLYGAEFLVGDAKISILRPARRCPAISVDPTTGDRDSELQNDLVNDYGHGFLGVYARVSQSGHAAVGDEIGHTNAEALAPSEMTCDLAPDINLWPKAAYAVATDTRDVFKFSPLCSLALAEDGAVGRMKVHSGPRAVLNGQVIRSSRDELIMRVEQYADEIERRSLSGELVLLSGPFANR
ncbi:MOSC domain-containing protein [uncultured Sulfitobacter sp.]|uniref:MOSC domain-containing protein n=1 Tax=uncultured Sulfitobacter sp. TaxID=191468 RepID=UPI002616179F|nr:MOSC domain-containing protein [uncultured Sulfitobacter sp.]